MGEAAALLKNFENQKIPKGLDIPLAIANLRKSKKFYQELAIVYESHGHFKISNRMLLMKQHIITIIDILLTWEENEADGINRGST